MFAIFIFLPYVIIPLLVALLFKRYKFPWIEQTYVLTALIIFFYPLGVFWIEDYLNPPPPDPRCLNPQMGFVMGNLFLLLPISIWIQSYFNLLFLEKKRQ